MCRAMKAALLTVILVLCVVLSACWIPENFEAKVAINKDGSYTFTYDGTLTFGLALAASKEGALSPADEAELQKEAAKIRQEPGFKKVEYQGKGHYKVFVEKAGKPGEPLYFVSQEFKLFAVLPNKQDHTVTVTGIRPSPEDIKQLNSIGAKIDGSLSVSVASGVKVIKQNAQIEPSLFGLVGAYRWQIKSPDAGPVIVVQPTI